jgi:hypothetical protein
LINPQATISKMASALQAVVDDKHGMTEETYRIVLGALRIAGIDPFPPPTFRPVCKPGYDDSGRDWWCINDKDKTFLCTDDGEFARFETEEMAVAAIAEEARQAGETDAEFSSRNQIFEQEAVVEVPRSLFNGVAGEQPHLSDEFGSCIFCNSADYQKYPSPNWNFYQHQESCGWRMARKIICESAGSTADANGVLSADEFRNYLRHRGFSLVSKLIRDGDRNLLFAYLPTEVVDENQWVATMVGLEPYFVCLDEQALPLTFAQQWCDARLSGQANIARVPDVS